MNNGKRKVPRIDKKFSELSNDDFEALIDCTTGTEPENTHLTLLRSLAETETSLLIARAQTSSRGGK